MTLKHLPVITASLFLSLLLGSCQKDCIDTYEYLFYQPVYTSWDDIRAEIGSEAPRDIKHPGKIFVIGELLFINEVGEGVHVINNADPSSPVNIKFINIPGSLDIAATSGILYSDNYADLIALDISDLDQVTELFRVPGVFFEDAIGFWFNNSEDSVVTGWEMAAEEMTFDCNDDIFFIDGPLFDGGMVQTAGGPVAMAESSASDAVGKAGSMARFAIYNTHLYALNQFEIHVFNIAGQLSLAGSQEVQWGMETIFPYRQHLFIGAMDGMHILNIEDPLTPRLVSTYSHVTSCDPVVVEEDLAYVTLRSGNECQGFTNQLEVIDISDLSEPTLLKTYEMFNPHGLGLYSGNLLFLCDGDDGLKVYDRTDHMDLRLIEHHEDLHAYDVIPYAGRLLMIGNDGFYQYGLTGEAGIELLSTIPVVP